jgi:membrane protease YdiL (CAAX protease family)
MATVSIARPQDTPAAAGARASWLARHPLLAYFALAYAVTWALWLPYFLSRSGLGLLPLALPQALVLLGQYGPTVAAFALAAATGGRPAVRGLLRRYGRWRVGPGWYPLVIAGPLVLLALAVVARVGTGPLGAIGGDGPSVLLEYVVTVLVLKLVLGGALGEEAGWRGFALPRLQGRCGPLAGSLILGALWAGWHAPLYLSPARVAQNPPLLFAVGVLAMAIIYTWVYNRTGGSLPLALLLHSAINSAPPTLRPLVPDLGATEFFALYIAGYVAVALLLVVATRGRLGYPPAPAPAGKAEG